jgi:hypothetical protein
MSRTLGGIAVAVAALALVSSGTAASPSTEGLHGAAIRDFTQFGFQGKWQLSANAQHLPSGDIVGELVLAGADLPLSDFFRLSSRPTYLEVGADTACVVGDVKSLKGEVSDWPTTPLQLFLKVRDVVSGPDLISTLVTFRHFDPALGCSAMSPAIEVTEGGFTINQ